MKKLFWNQRKAFEALIVNVFLMQKDELRALKLNSLINKFDNFYKFWKMPFITENSGMLRPKSHQK